MTGPLGAIGYGNEKALEMRALRLVAYAAWIALGAMDAAAAAKRVGEVKSLGPPTKPKPGRRPATASGVLP
jgi:hypothetical protein